VKLVNDNGINILRHVDVNVMLPNIAVDFKFEPTSLFLNRVTFPFLTYHFQFIVHNIYKNFHLPDMLVTETVDLRGNNYKHIKCEILTVAVIKNSIFWDIMSCSPLKVNNLGSLLAYFRSLLKVIPILY
jgi:hypothetical protein